MSRGTTVGATALLVAGIAWTGLAGKKDASAAPYIPARADIVLCAVSSSRTDVGALRARLDADPTNVTLAADLARRNIELARTLADPRYLGHAQAALGPWWDSTSPPAEVLLLRATIHQSVHEFEPALADLNQLLRSSPANAQAWLTRAIILSVRGDYQASKASCAPLERLADALVFTQCSATVDSLSGHAKEAYQSLVAAYARSRHAEAGERAWILSSLGEIAVRAGYDELAEKHDLDALGLSPSDGYTRAAYADLLLDRTRPAEAISLLRNHENDDNLLLRLAMAEDAIHAKDAAAHIAILRARYLASRARGDVVHRREQARFHLSLLHDAKSALELAKANWQIQREPADARILLESALAAHAPEEASPVIAFLAEHHAEEPRLLALVAQVGHP